MAKDKCFANVHMTCAEYGFWEVCRSLSHAFEGKLIFDGRKLAEHFSGENKDHIYRMEKSLRKAGWFVLLKKSKRGAKGMWVSAVYQVLSHEEWVAKHGKKSCKEPVSESRLDLSKNPDRLIINQSRNQEQSSLEIKNRPVLNSRHSIPIEPITPTKTITPPEAAPGATPFSKEDQLHRGQEQRSTKTPPVSKSRLDEPAELEGKRAGEIVNLLPHAQGMELYQRTGGSYTRDEAVAAYRAYKVSRQEATR